MQIKKVILMMSVLIMFFLVGVKVDATQGNTKTITIRKQLEETPKQEQSKRKQPQGKFVSKKLERAKKQEEVKSKFEETTSSLSRNVWKDIRKDIKKDIKKATKQVQKNLYERVYSTTQKATMCLYKVQEATMYLYNVQEVLKEQMVASFVKLKRKVQKNVATKGNRKKEIPVCKMKPKEEKHHRRKGEKNKKSYVIRVKNKESKESKKSHKKTDRIMTLFAMEKIKKYRTRKTTKF